MKELAFVLWLALPADTLVESPLPSIFSTTPSDETIVSFDFESLKASESKLAYASGPRGDLVSGSNPQPAFDLLSLNGQTKFTNADAETETPWRRDSTWTTDEKVQVPVNENVFVFGAVNAASDSVEQQQLRWQGRSGVGVRVRPWLFDEVQVKTGQGVRYDDANRPPRGYAQERSEMFLDVSTKLPVPILSRPVNVEYTGTSIPAITGYDRNKLNQDLKFAMPFADGLSQFQLGARVTWEETLTPTPWTDRAQLYLGVQLKR